MSNLYSIGQMNEHADALERNGWTPADLKKASGGDILAHLLPLVRKYGDIVPVATSQQYLIDCDADPFIPSDWSVDEHQKGGQIQFDSSKIELWLAKDQQKSKSMEGNKLRKELQSRKVLNANVLDYLLAHPELIPEEWKGKCLFFWGTIYRRSNGHLYVRFLYWFGDRWRWVGGWLDDGWRGNDPAVLSAS